jgi:hypothetical protein
MWLWAAAGALKEGDPAPSLLSESCMFSPTALNVERFWPVCLSSQVSSCPKPLKFLGTELPRAEGARNRSAKGAKAERYKAAKSRDFGYVNRYVSKSRSMMRSRSVQGWQPPKIDGRHRIPDSGKAGGPLVFSPFPEEAFPRISNRLEKRVPL